jgi:hypothetical protein
MSSIKGVRRGYIDHAVQQLTGGDEKLLEATAVRNVKYFTPWQDIEVSEPDADVLTIDDIFRARCRPNTPDSNQLLAQALGVLAALSVSCLRPS